MKEHKEIEKSIIKRYRKDIWSRFIKAVIEYKLIDENDNIMVCISGGKDSFLLAKCIEELQKHGKYKFNAHYVCMNPGYKEENKNKILENAKRLNIDLEMFDSDIFEIVDKIEKSPCYLCARMRRGCLYTKAKKLGCNKIALGHHFDDVIETTMLNMFYAGEIKTMLPKLHSENFEGLELIRPLYLVKEENIKSWAKYNKLNFINCACKFTNKQEDKGKREEIKNIIKELKKTNNTVDDKIFKSLDNVNVECVLGIVKDKQYESYIENYENKKQGDKDFE